MAHFDPGERVQIFLEHKGFFDHVKLIDLLIEFENDLGSPEFKNAREMIVKDSAFLYVRHLAQKRKPLKTKKHPPL